MWRWFSHEPERGVVIGDGAFEFHVTGTLKHQPTLESLCGGRRHDGVHRYCAALLVQQPWNPWDRSAVAVRIHDYEIGYLFPEAARDFIAALRHRGFADAACEAQIVGGWNRGRDDQGFFGVRLNACLPFQLEPARNWQMKNTKKPRLSTSARVQ